MYWKDKVVEHALKESPKECCGLLVNIKGKLIYKECKNLAHIKTDQFILNPHDYADIEDKYGNEAIEGIVHSHPHTSPIASPADLVCAARTNKHWYIVNPQTNEWYDFFPKEYKQSLIGRPWTWDHTNCWQLIREYFNAELDIQLIDFPKPNTPEEFSKNPLFEKYFEEAGFKEISQDDSLQKYDCVLMNLSGEVLNHVGVICDDFGNELLHHMQGRLSCKETYTSWFRKITGRIVRYDNLPS